MSNIKNTKLNIPLHSIEKYHNNFKTADINSNIYKQNFFLSIIIPFNNGKKYLEECLKSLSYQKIDAYEVILIINGLTEEIDDIINSYQRKIRLKIKFYKEEIGVSKARNEGIKLSEGKYIYFLDSDDYLVPNALDKLIKMAENSNADCISGRKIKTFYNIERFYNNYSQKIFDKEIEYHKGSDYELYINNVIPQRGNISNISVLHILIKKSILENEIFFDEDLRYFSDVPFILQVIEHSKTIKYVGNSIYAKRVRNDPINLPSLNQEDPDNKPLQYINTYIKSLNFADHREDLKIRIDRKIIDYYLTKFLPLIRKQKDNKLNHIHFKKLSEISSYFHPKAIKWYQKHEIKSLQSNDLKSAKRYLKFRLGIKKLKKICKNPKTIKTTIYYNIFNKLEINKNMIIFESFRGQYYNDSPRYIYEYLYENYNNSYEFIWIINDKNKKIPGNPKKIKRYSLSYYYYMAISKYWVINLRQPRRLVKRDEQVVLSTWHGTPLKKLGLDLDEIYSATPNIKEHYVSDASKWDYLVSANRYSTNILRSAFKYTGEVLEYGYPRNDILYDNNNELSNIIKENLGLPLDKKIILYAPTWRDDEYYDVGQYKFDLKLNLDKLQEELGEDYIVLIRTHYFIADNLDLTRFKEFAFNVSYYDDIAELYLISDILITDYSSVFFDFANLKRPILFYVYDYKKYSSKLRGFYIDMEKDLPGPLLFTTEQVINNIQNIDIILQEYKRKYDEFYNRFCYLDDGYASKRIIEKVFKPK
ncbi:MAG: bifunctional glycosyltransferase family 2 protein/CDP-glycerol:glycerophosphate glycerophosphotransferase [Methanobacterium sp.]|nr:bifunctional glycosyltransferase family 2 protein/CDP-glycerol:glycerophosphate glycerophosphotransferase [Methanobacterium sp.]